MVLRCFHKWFYFRECISLQQASLCWVCVGSTTTTEGLNDVGESTVELNASLCAAGLLLSLLSLLDLRRLSLDLAGTSQRSVHFTSEQWNGQVQLDASQGWDFAVVGQDGSLAREGEVNVHDILDERQFCLQLMETFKQMSIDVVSVRWMNSRWRCLNWLLGRNQKLLGKSSWIKTV